MIVKSQGRQALDREAKGPAGAGPLNQVALRLEPIGREVAAALDPIPRAAVNLRIAAPEDQ